MSIFLFFAIVAMNVYSQSYDCAHLVQSCISASQTIPLGVCSGTAGDSVACLITTPNPVWFCFQVKQAGKINIKLSTSPNRDIDFACWGPFAADTITEIQSLGYCSQLNIDTLSANHPSSVGANPADLGGYPIGNLIDCSFEAGSQEYVHIPDAPVGQWYIFLVTNYSNTATDLMFESDSSSIGTSNCDFCAAVDDFSSPIMSISPNPTSDLLNCVFETIRNRKLSIVDLTGKKVKSWESNLQKELIDVKALPNGVYFLKVEKDNRSFSQKFIIRKD